MCVPTKTTQNIHTLSESWTKEYWKKNLYCVNNTNTTLLSICAPHPAGMMHAGGSEYMGQVFST